MNDNITRQEFDELRTFVLDLYKRMRVLVEYQRTHLAQQLGSSEDFLETPYDQSRLEKRRRMVREILPD